MNEHCGSRQRRKYCTHFPTLTSLVTVHLRAHICKQQLEMANSFEKLELAVWFFEIFSSQIDFRREQISKMPHCNRR